MEKTQVWGVTNQINSWTFAVVVSRGFKYNTVPAGFNFWNVLRGKIKETKASSAVLRYGTTAGY